jgi:hypothetical protein
VKKKPKRAKIQKKLDYVSVLQKCTCMLSFFLREADAFLLNKQITDQ